MQNEIVILGKDVVEEARTWLGTPFVHQAARKVVGCDCIGLVRGIGRDLEIMDFDENDPEHQSILTYPMTPEPRRLIGALNYFFIRVRDNFREGDVILFAIEGVPTHVAIVSSVAKGTVIHTWRQRDKVVEMSYGPALKPTGIWRYPGVANPAGEWHG